MVLHSAIHTNCPTFGGTVPHSAIMSRRPTSPPCCPAQISRYVDMMCAHAQDLRTSSDLFQLPACHPSQPNCSILPMITVVPHFTLKSRFFNDDCPSFILCGVGRYAVRRVIHGNAQYVWVIYGNACTIRRVIHGTAQYVG